MVLCRKKERRRRRATVASARRQQQIRNSASRQQVRVREQAHAVVAAVRDGGDRGRKR